MRGTGDLKMSQVLASAFGEVVKSDGRVDERELTELLKKMPVSIGAGKQTVHTALLESHPCMTNAICAAQPAAHRGCLAHVPSVNALAGQLVRFFAYRVHCGCRQDL